MEFSRIAATLAFTALLASPACARAREKELLKRFDAAAAKECVHLAPALGRLKSKKAVDLLLLALDVKSGDPRETAAIVDALGLSGDPRAVEGLSGAWDYLRSMAVQLGELPASFQSLRVNLLESLGRLGGEQAVAILVESLNDKDSRAAEEAVRGLGRLRIKDAVPALQQLAQSRPDMTQAVFETFAEIGDNRAVSILQQAALSQDKSAEIAAAYALVKLGRKENLDRLLSALKSDPGSEKAGILAAYYLVKLDRAAGLDHLVSLMQNPASLYCVLAAEALGKSGNPRAVSPLSEAARAEDSYLRLAVARSLGRLGGRRAISVLKKMRADANAGVRNAALSALTELGELD